jgi:uncharacterized protein YcaQ
LTSRRPQALRSMAAWLSLESFEVGAKGNLARPLKDALR